MKRRECALLIGVVEKILLRAFEHVGAVFELTEARVASRTEDATHLAARPMVMVYVSVSATAQTNVANGTPVLLRSEHLVVRFQGDAVPIFQAVLTNSLIIPLPVFCLILPLLLRLGLVPGPRSVGMCLLSART